MYGGDDGVTPNIDPSELNKTFAKLGLLSKAETILPFERVPFLGRVYVDPWTNTHSFIDVPRQLRKLHLTIAPRTVPDNVCFLRKALGYLITDANTPIITEWSKKIISIFKDVPIDEFSKRMTQGDLSYWAKFENPFEPLTAMENTLAIAWISETLGKSITDVSNMVDWMKRSKTIEDLFSRSFEADLKVELTAVYRGTIVSGSTKNHQAAVRANKKRGYKPPQPANGTKKKN
jgi:hypothetical protein